MLLGIISDTHGHVEFLRGAVAMLAEFEVDEVLHCGDIGSTAIVRMLAEWPTHYVLGNCDDDEDVPELRAAMEAAGHTLHGRFAALERGGKRIAIIHGDDGRRLEETIAGGQFDLVCHGHTHMARCERRGEVLVLNPGALYRANPHSMAIVELPGLSVTSISL
ncbi:MAG: YfcE family phosphodiesterase [Planctomycetia bacterium]|nr:YfcE family phosphodiesterase [Planctomycetia bacterium]